MPHLLRRVKEEVEHSIPKKEETLIDVELTTLQARCRWSLLLLGIPVPLTVSPLTRALVCFRAEAILPCHFGAEQVGRGIGVCVGSPWCSV
jgi:hypothetical protein